MLVAVASALVLSSCNRKVDYESKAFVTLYKKSVAVAENVGQVKIPVMLYNASGDVQVSVTLTEGTAVEGTDYELVSPANGVLTFTSDVDSLDIVIDIVSYEGEFTGGKEFTVQVAPLTEGVSVPNGNMTTAKVSITDLDHPLAPFLGTWSGTTKEEFSGASVTMTYNIAAHPEDYDKVIVNTSDFIIGVDVELGATAVLNPNGTGVLTIPTGQPIGMDLNVGPGVYMGVNTTTFTGASGYADIVMNLNADGTMTVPNGYGVFDDQYIYGCYIGGFTLTKQ